MITLVLHLLRLLPFLCAGQRQLALENLALRQQPAGSSGIGLEVARQARAHGERVMIVRRDRAKLAAAAEQVGKPGTTLFALDAHDEVALEHFFAEVDAFDHLVSMVGDSMAGGFLTTTPETMRHVLHSKFWSNWMIGRYAAPRVREGGSHRRPGRTRPRDLGQLRREPWHWRPGAGAGR
jgi:NAD(P)-dependent dehydrogenase (short-subunit alcohol dehydrogenase family)